jgi:type II secretory pathway component PulK
MTPHRIRDGAGTARETASAPRLPSFSSSMDRARGRGGFALVSVLWIVVGIAALAMIANVAAREGIASARNRADLARAAWRAEDCLARARAVIGDALAGRGADGTGTMGWDRMDAVVAQSPLLPGPGCEVRMTAAGAALDVNATDGETVRRLLVALGRSPGEADSLADALADWRDADGTPRPYGAEAAWYAAAGMRAPRDGPLADVRELARVRGWARVGGIDTLLSAEPGRVPLSHAPAAVLATLPGLGAEAAGRLGQMRLRGEGVTDLAAFVSGLSPGARDEAMRRYTDLVGVAVVEPEAWIVTARGTEGTPPAVSAVEVRLVRAPGRTAVLRRRTWTE